MPPESGLSTGTSEHGAEDIIEVLLLSGLEPSESLEGTAAPKASTTCRSSFTLRGLQLIGVFPLVAVFIILLAALRVAQYLVGLIDLLEAFLGFLIVRVEVRVMLPGQFPIGLLDLVGRRIPIQAQQLVVVHAFLLPPLRVLSLRRENTLDSIFVLPQSWSASPICQRTGREFPVPVVRICELLFRKTLKHKDSRDQLGRTGSMEQHSPTLVKTTTMNKPIKTGVVLSALAGSMLLFSCSNTPAEQQETMNDKMENVQEKQQDMDLSSREAFESDRKEIADDLRDMRDNIDKKLSNVNEDLAKTDLKADVRAEKTAMKAELEREKVVVSNELEKVEGATSDTWNDIKIEANKTSQDVKNWWEKLKDNVDQRTDADKDKDGH